MSLSSVRSETALRSRLFSSSRSFRRFTCSVFSPPNSGRHREYVTSLTPIWRIASAMGCPCETRTSTCRSFATISSGLYRFLAITVLLDVEDIPQVGPLQWGGSIVLRDCPVCLLLKFDYAHNQSPAITHQAQSASSLVTSVSHRNAFALSG